jgi:phosphohistidine phosphatase
MDLYVVRHGIAEVRREGLRDADRELTPKGEKRFRRCVRGLEALEVRLDRVLTSPWTRARRTAELLAPVAEGEPRVEEGLARDPDPELLAAIAETGGERVAVVGHEPWLSELTAWLVTGELGGAQIVLKKGSVVHLRGEPEPGRMELRASMPPKVLVALAKT